MVMSNLSTEMFRRLCWSLLLSAYWTVVVHFLRAASPVFIDGGGPTPSFSWGHMPQPNYGEYMRRQNYYDFIYALLYYVAGLVLTLVGCGASP